MSNAPNLSPAAPRPAHITDAVMYDFDMFADPAYVADPHARILDLLKNAPPIFWTPRNGGHWMLLSHSANFNASRDTESFSSEIVPQAQFKAMMAQLPPGSPHIPQPLPITIDPPAHTAYRMPLQRAFSPKAMLALKDSIRDLAVDLIEKIKAKGGADFLTEVAEPLPVQVFLKMFGLPLERQQEYRVLVKEHMEGIKNPDPRAIVRRMLKLTSIMRETVLERKENPRDDLISMLWQADIGGKPTTLEDMENYCVVLFTAGLDTVVNGIGLGVLHLARDAELQAKLRQSPELIPKAAEELLRRYTFTVPIRRVAKDMNFQGVDMKSGERAMLFLPAADLDSAEYPEAGKYDLNRETVHVAFGMGPHRCLGSHLARLELQVIYEELLARLPAFKLDPAKPVAYHGGHVVGPESLWLSWAA
ncbi:cytochrome P450 [Solimonas sp. K1W22B-7]|uniref:cytochrome P450 n=1 Tax=Solimonas sp. K1W22B-7 TaxID=2303331 RepID=UPI000E32F147|nr:cytochrome P450 [Solimonas sp. K1W22B-7]AXQ30667.1 cytochrome P450 [Solimonas sp. K1W22B-7]